MPLIFTSRDQQNNPIPGSAILVCKACVKPNISCEFFFNSSRIDGMDSSTIELSLNKSMIVDSLLLFTIAFTASLIASIGFE